MYYFWTEPRGNDRNFVTVKIPFIYPLKKKEKKSVIFFMRPLGYCIFIYFFICDKISMLFTKGLLASSLDEIRNL